jgi:glycosyltransferase involved in cell wall biosynthesis
MPAVYASLDVFVLASIDEGMPMTILEALAAKRPVVATRVGAVDKVVLSQQTGLLVAARSAPALQEAILRCLRDPYFSRGLAQKGFELVHGAFSAEAMARQYLDIYHDVLFKRETVARPSFREA